ncbi:LacI family transcriptional regulator [Paenibacillus sp. TRM 82003]|nr:LacI family transcriptional regulator [Paenibacillus sp. TRM 82003]
MGIAIMKQQDVNSTTIAKLAGVSRSTVSRVINNYPNVPPETREKVQRVIDQYKYSPLACARMLAGKKAETIGLFVIDDGRVSGDMLSSMMMVAVIEQASALGYHVLTDVIRGTGEDERVRAVKEMFYQRRIDGGLFIGAANREPLVEELIADGFLIALFDHDLEGRSEPNRIVANFDNLDGMRQIASYLTGLGHRRIGFLAGDRNRLSGETKYEAFLTAMAEAAVDIVDDWIVPGTFSEQGGYDGMSELLRRGVSLPSAIVAANDSVAFGAVRAMREAGIAVPHDVSIVGFDDHMLSERFHPALTTARIDFRALLGRLTLGLVERIEQENESSTPLRYTAGYELVVRDSCRPV